MVWEPFMMQSAEKRETKNFWPALVGFFIFFVLQVNQKKTIKKRKNEYKKTATAPHLLRTEKVCRGGGGDRRGEVTGCAARGS
jgi:hypothetical protein